MSFKFKYIKNYNKDKCNKLTFSEEMALRMVRETHYFFFDALYVRHNLKQSDTGGSKRKEWKMIQQEFCSGNGRKVFQIHPLVEI